MAELLLKQNTILAQRMLAFDMSNVGMTQSQAQLAMTLPGAVYWNSSAISGSSPYGAGIDQPLSTDPGPPIPSDPNLAKRNTRGFAFEELLMNSRAYRNAARNNTDALSVATSAGRTATWSMLSGISLSETSNIAILALPVYEVDLNDKNIYNFEPPRTEDLSTLPSSDLTRPENVSSSSHRRVKDWWKSINKTDQSLTSPLAISAEPEQHIFDVRLAESIRHANVAISLTNEQGEAFIYGYIPIIVAKVCVYLKEKGIDVPEVFAHNGNALRVQRLYTAFGLLPRYGKGLDWTGYTVFDAATIMLRYLKSLPEPIVPFAFYTRFTEPLRQLAISPNLNVDSGKHKEVLKIYQGLVRLLPSLHRQLLLYLLDLLAVFASKSDHNRMTADRLVVCFQPSLISAPPEKMDEAEHKLAADVGSFLVNWQDHFLIG
ncbi:GTPase activating protein (GAP) for Rho1p [Lithohypha guttulata]|uniref:GTPase activating protein (GAP) for Rho1p n=1 Tax=Lithohypha guttulata TaxID=1690604 RepID=UPI00315CE77E